MAVTAVQVKELREKTNAGMLDCKKALEETQGNFEAAVEWLRVKGLSSAAKKAGRIAAEGLVYAFSTGKSGVVVEVNSETDFVSRNDAFKDFVKNIGNHVAQSPPATGDLLEQAYALNPSQKLGDVLKETISKIGENIVIRRVQKYELAGHGLVHTYVHGEGKIGVLIEATAGSADGASKPEFKSFVQDVALHIAAMNPMAISSSELSPEVIAKEKEILKAKNLEEGKKAEMVDKIVEGQIRKFLAENCLLDQSFVKNPDIKVSELLKTTVKNIGADVTIKRFTRFELGEGIQKKQVDFAAEVAEQMKGH
ncbi:MAG: elongation factor Ts [Bdellovibrionaceae bacterium]|nr:elongation factor Ts [Pseudobdellovibrionaceae bacterium]